MAAFVIVPLIVVTFLLDVVALKEVSLLDPNAAVYEKPGGQIRIVNESTYNLAVGIQALLSALASLLVTAGVLKAVGSAYVGRDVTAGESFRFGLGKVHSVLWIMILFTLGIAVGFLLLILPGIWLMVAWAFALPALVFEGVRGSKALGRSFGLVRKHWWHAFGALLLGYVLIFVVQLLLPLLVGAIGSSIDDVILYNGLLDIVLGLLNLFVFPFFAALLTVIYYDLRVRKEGYDVQLLTQELSGEPTQPVTGPAPDQA